MAHFSVLLTICVAAAAVAQPREASRRSTTRIVIAAVSRNKYMFTGGMGQGERTREGLVVVEPVGFLTPSGEWINLPCSSRTQDTAAGRRGCLAFAHTYLRKQHTYTVISADGNGAAVQASPTTLDACYDYTGTGTYSGVAIRKSAVAATSAEFFSQGSPAQALGPVESAAVSKALRAFVPGRLDTTKDLHFFSVRLEGHEMVVVQRVFDDKPGDEVNDLIFGIGTMERGRFHAFRWKRSGASGIPEKETLVGTIALRNGHQFLITTVSDPESQVFRVYGIRDGRLKLVYEGGGASC